MVRTARALKAPAAVVQEMEAKAAPVGPMDWVMAEAQMETAAETAGA